MGNSRTMEATDERLGVWKQYWTDKTPFWHKKSVNQFLARHWPRCEIDFVPARIFVPLCGKTIDMKWLYEQGHHVVGLDGVIGPVQDFFQDHNIEFTVDEKDGLTHLSTKDGRLEVYICDMMVTDPAKFGKFDMIWDRGSLVAITYDDRDKYANFIKGIMGPKTKYLFNAIMYDQSRWPGPPMSVSHEAVNALYGDVCEIETLETVPRTFEHLGQCGAAPNDQGPVEDQNEAYEVIILMKPK